MDNENNGKRKKDYSQIIIVILVSTVFIIFAYLFFLPHHTLRAADCNKTDIANAMMIELNAINNILTWGSFIIATLTIIAAVFGIVGFVEYKKSVNKDLEQFKELTSNHYDKINSNITVIENYKKEIDNRVSMMESFKDSITVQSRYLNKSIDYLYNVLSSLTEKLDDQLLRDMLFHDFYISTLYRYDFDPDSKESKAILHHKKAAIEFLKDKGTIEDIKDLEIVAENEPNEEIKQKIYELIGIIKHNKS